MPIDKIFTSKISKDLVLHSSVREWLLGLNALNLWNARGVNAHVKNDSIEKQIARSRIQILNNLKNANIQNKIKIFVSSCDDVYQNIMLGRFYKLPTRNFTFNFVIGAMRTGGTQLFTELCKSIDFSYQKFHMPMLIDSIPSYRTIYESYNPSCYRSMIYELSQFIVWSNKAFKGKRKIIQKRIAYNTCIPMLEAIFQGKVKFYITMRDPQAAFLSMKKLKSLESLSGSPVLPPNWDHYIPDRKLTSVLTWNRFSLRKKFFLYLSCYYDAILLNPPDKKQSFLSITPSENSTRNRLLTQILPMNYDAIRKYKDAIRKEI